MNTFKAFRAAQSLVKIRARNFSTGVYLWTEMPRMAPKA